MNISIYLAVDGHRVRIPVQEVHEVDSPVSGTVYLVMSKEALRELAVEALRVLEEE